MKKKLLITGGIVAALALVVYIGMTFFLGSIVKAGVNNFAPKVTGTKVTLDSATISPLTGSGTLNGLFVGNPEGWKSDRAFYLGKIHVDVDPFSILGDHIVINEIIIDQPEFVYETKLVASNIKDLLKNIENFTGGAEKKEEAEPKKESKPIKIVVKKFRLTNAKATLGVGAAALPVPLPPLSLDDVGVKEGGITPDQLAGVVMKQVLGNIVAGTGEALKKVGATTGAAAAEGVKKVGSGIKKLFGGE